MAFNNFIHNSWIFNVWGLLLMILSFVVWVSFLGGLEPFSIQIFIPIAALAILYLIKREFALTFIQESIVVKTLIFPKKIIHHNHIEAIVIRRSWGNKRFNTYHLVIRLDDYPYGYSIIQRTNYDFPGIQGREIVVPSITKETLQQIVREIKSIKPDVEVIEYDTDGSTYIMRAFLLATVIAIVLGFLLYSI
jgi:hypothetical protein